MNLIKYLAKPALWVVGRLAGQAEVDRVQTAIASTTLQREIEANKPAIQAAIGVAVAGLDAAAAEAVTIARTRIIAQVDKLGMSPAATAKVVAVVSAVAVPAVDEADKLIQAFATAVAGEVAKL